MRKSGLLACAILTAGLSFSQTAVADDDPAGTWSESEDNAIAQDDDEDSGVPDKAVCQAEKACPAGSHKTKR